MLVAALRRIALNDAGTILAVGADGVAGGNGTVYLFACSSGVCGPTPVSILPAPAAPADAAGIPLHFGRAISLGNASGSLLLIGAPQLCCGESGRYSVGYAYISYCSANAVCSAPLLIGEGGQGEYFGDTLVASEGGSLVAVGSYGRGGTGALFTTSCSGSSCGTLDLIMIDSAQRFDEVGAALAVRRDGSLLYVGAPGRSSQEGSVFALSCTPSLGTCNSTAAVEYVAADASPSGYENFGSSVALSADGSTLAIGTDSGKMYLTLTHA